MIVFKKSTGQYQNQNFWGCGRNTLTSFVNADFNASKIKSSGEKILSIKQNWKLLGN